MKWNMLVGSLVLGASLCTPSFAGHGLLDRMMGLRGAGCDSTCCDTGCGAGPSCGCEVAPSCGCENACGPACGVGPSCGCENACGVGPSCGIENACGVGPNCGCETACAPSCDTGCCQPRRKPLHELLCAARHKGHHLLHHLRGHRNACDTGCCEVACEPSCGIAEPACGCEQACVDPCAGACGAPSCGCEVAACDTGCGRGRHHGGLLARIFKHRHRNECCDLGCDSCGVAAGCNSCGGGVAPAAPAVGGEAAPMPPAPVVDPSAYLQSNRRVIQATSYVR